MKSANKKGPDDERRDDRPPSAATTPAAEIASIIICKSYSSIQPFADPTGREVHAQVVNARLDLQVPPDVGLHRF